LLGDGTGLEGWTMARRNTPVRFGVLTFAGLADITRRELQPCRPTELTVLRLRNYDLLVGAVGRGDLGRLAGLRTAEDVFHMMGRPVPIAGQRDLAKVAPMVTTAGILDGVSVKNTVWGSRRRRSHTFTCFVKQDRDREVRRKSIAAAVTARVASCFPRWRHADPAEIEFWGFYIEEVLHLGLRLSDEGMKYRGREPQRRTGALRPTIAAALALLADPGPGSFVVDPMCGTGTILEEAFAREERARYAGGDSAQEAVDLARQRLAAHGIAIERWDARRLPLEEGGIDCIVCNLPFGKRYSTPGENPSLYRALVSNWQRKLKPRGRMVLLTADSRALEDCLLGLGLSWRKECRVKVLGAWATVYAVENAQSRL
jgi:tRNA (guanine6-N2)-methyltransferase